MGISALSRKRAYTIGATGKIPVRSRGQKAINIMPSKLETIIQFTTASAEKFRESLPPVLSKKTGTYQAPTILSLENARIYTALTMADLDDYHNTTGNYPVVSVTGGNTKLSGIPSIGFNPFATCGHLCNKCYAAYKMNYRHYNKIVCETVNTWLLKNAPDVLLEQLDSYLTLNAGFVPFFRVFESGDAINADSFRVFFDLARLHPETHFMLYTKKYAYFNHFLKVNGGRSYIPENMVCFFSAFEDYITPAQVMAVNPYNIPLTNVIENNSEAVEAARSAGCFICPGAKTGCRHCLECWKAKYMEAGNTSSIAFKLH